MKLKRRHYLILEEMLKHPEGVTRKEIVELIQRDGETGYNRKAFVKDLPLIRQAMDIDIFSRDCGKNVWRYSIGRSTPDQQERAKMVGILVANILENLFLKEFRELGEKVQPGGINIQSVQNLYQADVLKGLGIELEVKKKDEQTDLPTREEMQQAVMKTYRQGYWWGNRSWAVVYRVYQMRGYMNSIAQFVREVEEWELRTGFECNYDAIQKPIAKGVLSGTPDKWIEQGAQSQAVKLAEVLAEELDKSSRISI